MRITLDTDQLTAKAKAFAQRANTEVKLQVGGFIAGYRDQRVKQAERTLRKYQK